jgi:DNA-binding beta-propeller fold protein YncE
MAAIRSVLCVGVLAAAIAAGPAAAQNVPAYLATIGVTDTTGSDSAHFNNPASVAVDTVNGHVLVVDQVNERVQIFDSTSFAYVSTLGTSQAIGSDNAHFYLPQGVGFDATHDRILVADAENERVQIFDAATLAYVATLGTTGTLGATNAEFDLPTGVAYDPAHNQILVADQNNDRVQVFDGSSFAYVATIGQTGISEFGPGFFSFPAGVDVDTVNHHILVADQNNNEIQILEAGTFTLVGVIGDPNGNPGTGNTQFDQPNGVAFDPVNDRILVADFDNARVQVYDAASFGYLGTIGETDTPGSTSTELNGPASVAINKADGQVFVVDAVNQRVQVFGQQALPASLVSAVLPGSRSVEIGTAATVFSTMLNTGSASLADCQIGLPATAPAGLTLGYQTTNASNQLTGSANTPAIIAGNGAQNFLLTFQSAAAFQATAMPLLYSCTGSQPAPGTPGVNTVDLLFSTTPIPDVIALAATASNNGIVTIPFSTGGAAAFAAASIDVGSAGTLTVAADTGAATLPLVATVCATNASTGACLSAPAASFQQSFQSNGAQTFSVFLSAGAPITFAPATARVFLRFLDSSGVSHGSTSVAVETN